MDDNLGGCAAGEPFALQVLGDSMEPEFMNGVVIIIDPEGIARDGCYVMARIGEDDYIFRQLRVDGESYRLVALKESYEEITITSLDEVMGIIVQQQAGKGRKGRKFYNYAEGKSA